MLDVSFLDVHNKVKARVGGNLGADSVSTTKERTNRAMSGNGGGYRGPANDVVMG